MRPPGLTLFHYPGCMYCGRVWAAAKALGLDLDHRNIWVDAEAASSLGAATGRQTVPVLRIEEPGQGERWLSESADIVTYLYATFGNGKRPGLLSSLNPQVLLMVAAVAAIAVDNVAQPSWPWPWLLPLVAFGAMMRRA